MSYYVSSKGGEEGKAELLAPHASAFYVVFYG